MGSDSRVSRRVKIIGMTSVLSLGLSVVLLGSVSPRYEGRTTLEFQAEMPENVPVWAQVWPDRKHVDVIQYDSIPLKAAEKANRLAAYFLRKYGATVPVSAAGSDDGLGEADAVLLKKIEDLKSQLAALGPDTAGAEPSAAALVSVLLTQPELAISGEQQALLKTARAPYLAYQSALAEHKRLSGIYGPLHPRWKVQLATEQNLRAALIAALKSDGAGDGQGGGGAAQRIKDQILFLQNVAEQQKQVRHQAAQKKASFDQAHIRQFSAIPVWPVYPRWAETLGLAFVLSVLAGLLLSVLDRGWRTYFFDETELEDQTGIPCFGVISRDGWPVKDIPDFILRPSGGEVASKLRSLRTVLNMLGTQDGKPPRLILLTGDHVGNVAAILSIWLGRLAAKSGEKALFVDADLYGAVATKILGLRPEATLADYLAGQSRLEDMLGRSDSAAMHIIPAGCVPNTASDLIASEKMKNLLRSFGQFYDVVFVHVPELSSRPDALTLSSLADQILILVDSRKTTRAAMIDMARKLKVLGISRLCTALLR